MRTRLLGEHVDFPVGASPTAFHCLAHPDGELATARGEGKLTKHGGHSMHILQTSTFGLFINTHKHTYSVLSNGNSDDF